MNIKQMNETPEPGFPRKISGSHPNFQNEKSRIERLLVETRVPLSTCCQTLTVKETPSSAYGLRKSAVRRHTADMES